MRTGDDPEPSITRSPRGVRGFINTHLLQCEGGRLAPPHLLDRHALAMDRFDSNGQEVTQRIWAQQQRVIQLDQAPQRCPRHHCSHTLQTRPRPSKSTGTTDLPRHPCGKRHSASHLAQSTRTHSPGQSRCRQSETQRAPPPGNWCEATAG